MTSRSGYQQSDQDFHGSAAGVIADDVSTYAEPPIEGQESVEQVSMEGDGSWQQKFKRNKKMLLGSLAFIGMTISGLFFGNLIGSWLVDGRGWFLRNSPSSAGVFIILYICLIAFLFPFTPFAIASGYIWGIPGGLLVQCSCNFLSGIALLSFSRQLSHSTVTNLLQKDQRIWLLTSKLMKKQNAAWLNFVLCFVPIAAGLHVYAFTTSELSILMFSGVYLIGMIPTTLLDVIVGHTLYLATYQATGNKVHTIHIIGLVMAIIGAFAAATYIGRIVNRHLKEAEAEAAAAAEASERDPLLGVSDEEAEEGEGGRLPLQSAPIADI